MTLSSSLWPLHILRLTHNADALAWYDALQRFAPFALPWVMDDTDNTPPLSAQQWTTHALSAIPNVWLGVDSLDPTTATVWMSGSLEDVIIGHRASIHGMAHPLFNSNVLRHGPKKDWTKYWIGQALLDCAFNEYHCQTLTATIPATHSGARGFCLSHGFRPVAISPLTQQPAREKTYQLTAQRYFASTLIRRNAHVSR